MIHYLVEAWSISITLQAGVIALMGIWAAAKGDFEF